MRRRTVAVLIAGSVACGGAENTSPVGTCAGAQAFSVGASVTGTAGANECAVPGGAVGQIYSLTLTAPTTGMLVTMTPSGFSGAMALFSGSPASPASAKIIFSLEGTGVTGARAFLPAGSYFVAAGRSGSGGGQYTLTSAPAQNDNCAYESWTTVGVTLSGSIATGDCTGGLGSAQDIYELRLAAGQSVSVSATIARGGAVLWRSGDASSASLIERPLNSGGTTSFTFTAPSAGSYRLHVLNNNPATGASAYTATIQ